MPEPREPPSPPQEQAGQPSGEPCRPPGHPARPQVLLAFDVGTRRIGMAAGDTLTRTAAPRAAAVMRPGGPDWDAIARSVRELAPARLIVGLPYNADGTAGPMVGRARRFGAALAERFGLPVDYADERYSSLEAARALAGARARGERRRVRKQDVDSAAAAVILERWLAGQTG
ncbi:MAG TPA: Holliday junction resolvase RuvX [Steroidobacteraceae bacterium]|nr:Holliday junction resolvase RuvX [Steroidobacteraceae bacterium]